MALSCGWPRPSIHHFTIILPSIHHLLLGSHMAIPFKRIFAALKRGGGICLWCGCVSFCSHHTSDYFNKTCIRLVFFFDTTRGLVSVMIHLILEPASGCYSVGPRGTCATITTSGGHAALGPGHKCFIFEGTKIQRMPKQVFFDFFLLNW